MPRKPSKRIPTNQAAQMGDDERKKELQNLAFGDSWDKWCDELFERIDGQPNAPVLREATSRALARIKDSMFDKL